MQKYIMSSSSYISLSDLLLWYCITPTITHVKFSLIFTASQLRTSLFIKEGFVILWLFKLLSFYYVYSATEVSSIRLKKEFGFILLT